MKPMYYMTKRNLLTTIGMLPRKNIPLVRQ